MKKLLIMSMALLLGVTSSFSQVKTRTVKTVKSNSAAMDEIKQKTSDAYNAVKNQASREILKKKTGTKNGRVTIDDGGPNDLIATKPGSTSGKVTRPSTDPGSKGKWGTGEGDPDIILLKPGTGQGRPRILALKENGELVKETLI